MTLALQIAVGICLAPFVWCLAVALLRGTFLVGDRIWESRILHDTFYVLCWATAVFGAIGILINAGVIT